jgi:hypothetical protein
VAAPSARAAVIPITLADFANPLVLDFEGIPTGPIATNDPLFTSGGLTSVTVSGGNTPTDVFSLDLDGQGLSSIGGVLSVVGPGQSFDTVTGVYNFNLANFHNKFGFQAVDGGNHVIVEFLINSFVVDVFLVTGHSGNVTYLESTNPFNRVRLTYTPIPSLGVSGEGYDNITLEGPEQTVPEPGTLGLLGIGVLAFLGLRRKRRLAPRA